MIYLIHGTDTEKSREKTRVLTDALQKKKPDALFYRITSENYTENPISFLASGQGLFESKYIVFYDNLFNIKEAKEEILSALKELKESDNIFILLEGLLDKKTLDKIKKHAEKIQEYSLSASAEKVENNKKAGDWNPFAITDALVSGNKKKFWKLLLEAKKRGSAPEEIHGILWWQTKALKLASISKDAKEADISPFVFSKAKSALKNFSDTKIDTMLFDLVTMYHEAHRGEVDLWIAMERWGLDI